MAPPRVNLVRVDLTGLRTVVRYRRARNMLLLGVFARMPISGLAIVLTLHVVQTMRRSYAEAGLIVSAQTVAIAVSSPLRGRLLDTRGLRRVVAPCVLVDAAAWCAAPFANYPALCVIAAVAGIFSVPFFTIIRQAVMASVTGGDRRAALSLESVSAELAFMTGPVVAMGALSVWSTRWVLMAAGLAMTAGGAVLWIANPPLRGEPDRTSARTSDAARHPARGRAGVWSAHFGAVCTVAATTVLVLSGTDIAIIAGLRHFDAQALIGVTSAVWGFGSIVGGLVYGAWPRPIRSSLLLIGLAVVTAPAALAVNPLSLAVLCTVAGLLCAPTITATIDELSRIVPESSRGEAMGWHGSAMTVGGAIGAPLAGYAVDRSGFPAALVVASVAGLVVALMALAVTSRFGVRAGPVRPDEPECDVQPDGATPVPAPAATR